MDVPGWTLKITKMQLQRGPEWTPGKWARTRGIVKKRAPEGVPKTASK